MIMIFSLFLILMPVEREFKLQRSFYGAKMRQVTYQWSSCCWVNCVHRPDKLHLFPTWSIHFHAQASHGRAFSCSRVRVSLASLEVACLHIEVLCAICAIYFILVDIHLSIICRSSVVGLINKRMLWLNCIVWNCDLFIVEGLLKSLCIIFNIRFGRNYFDSLPVEFLFFPVIGRTEISLEKLSRRGPRCTNFVQLL